MKLIGEFGKTGKPDLNGGYQILIPKKTKKFEFGKKFMAILFGIKNNPYTPIFSLVGVGVGGISD